MNDYEPNRPKPPPVPLDARKTDELPAWSRLADTAVLSVPDCLAGATPEGRTEAEVGKQRRWWDAWAHWTSQVTLLALTLPTVACGPGQAVPSGAGPLPRLTEVHGRFVDAEGREVILRGINARVAGIFDVAFDDGRTALEPIPEFTGEDCRVIAEDLGMNHLRLPVNWSAIEPERDVFDSTYLDRIAEVVAECHDHGVYTLVDLHQDAYGKDIGEDGAPLWAIKPEPTELLEGPLLDLAARRTSLQVLRAFESLWDNVDGLQVEYAEMAAWLAVGIVDLPGVVGLELMNEPVILKDHERLDVFHRRVGDAVRAAAPELPLFFEPNVTRNFSDAAPVRTPFPFDNTAYAPHIYTDVFEDGWASADVDAVRRSVSLARSEADAHDAALYVGEFGNSPDSLGQKYLRTALDAFDAQVASAAWWVYEEESQDSWGLYEIPPNGERVAREELAWTIARPFPAAIAGKILEVNFDNETSVLRVRIANAVSDVPHVLSMPRIRYADGVEITCDGAAVETRMFAGRVEAFCGGEWLQLAPKRRP